MRSPAAALGRGRAGARLWGGLAVVGSMLAGALLSIKAGQSTDSDLANYHYFVPFWFFQDGLRDVAVAGANGYYNPTIDFPLYALMRLVAPGTFAFVVGLWQGLSGPFVYLIARRLGLGRLFAVVVAVAALLSATTLGEYGSSQGDTLLAPFLLAGIWLLLRGYSDGRRVAYLNTAAGTVLLGAAAGLKWVVGPIVVGAVVALAVVGAPQLDRVRRLLIGMVGAGVGVAVTYGWWAVELWRNFDDPLFPLFNTLLHSPYAANATFTGANDTATTIGSIITFPFDMQTNYFLTGLVPFHQYGFPALEVLGAALVVLGLARSARHRRWEPLFSSPERRFLGVLFIVAYVTWILSTGIYRYMVALEMLSFAMVTVLLLEVWRLLGARWVAWPLALAAVVVILSTQQIPDWGRMNVSSTYFTVDAPSSLISGSHDFIYVDAGANSYVATYFPARDEFVRVSSEFPLTPKMAALAASRLPPSVPTYALYGDPNEVGETIYEVDPDINADVGELGFHLASSADCVHFTTGYDFDTYQMYACPLIPLVARGG